MNAIELIPAKRIVPVVVINDAAHAVPLAEALVDSGIESIEVTLRTSAAMSAITAIAQSSVNINVGAGSVATPDQLRAVKDIGAEFAVCPGATEALLDAAISDAIPLVPGASTASEVLALLERGYTLQKFFPAELLGGLNMIRALSAPIRTVQFFPTGGIHAGLAADYLESPSVHCIGGSWFVPSAALDAGDFDEIGRLSREAQGLIPQ